VKVAEAVAVARWFVQAIIGSNSVSLRTCLKTREIWDLLSSTKNKGKQKRNSGVSPLRRAMKLHGSGRDDEFLDRRLLCGSLL
jgi:hypothetical protein